MIWGRQDPHVPFEARVQIHEALEKAGTNYQWLEFNGAHAFLRDEGPRYNPVLAQQCYTIALELYKRKLAEGDLSAKACRWGRGDPALKVLPFLACRRRG